MNIDEQVRAWIERLGAVVIGAALLNVNVTDRGDPLTAISTESKPVLYAVLALVGVAVALWSASQAVRDDVQVPRFRSLASSMAFLAASGVAGLGLDYQDGPVRMVQLIVYVMVALAAIRVFGLALALRAHWSHAAPDPDRRVRG